MRVPAIGAGLSTLERLVGNVGSDDSAPLAYWCGRLAASFASDGLLPAQSAQLHGIIERLTRLEDERGKRVAL